MLRLNHILPILFALAFASCDEGRLYEGTIVSAKEGRVVKITGDMVGVGSWTDGFQLVIAGFGDSDYAEITKEITSDVTVLSGIPDDVTTVEICAVNRLRKRVVSFRALEIADRTVTDTIRWDVGTCGGTMYDGIQARVFDTTCANCHGASNYAAAGLYLTAGRSYDAIVGTPSRVSPGDIIIVPGDPESSLMYRILTTDMTSAWRYDHSVEVVDQSILNMISVWIENNAQK